MINFREVHLSISLDVVAISSLPDLFILIHLIFSILLMDFLETIYEISLAVRQFLF